MKIAYIEPFYSDSHKYWIDSYVRRSSHKINVLGLSGQHWRWRMKSGAIALAEQYRQQGQPYDLLLVSDMCDLPLFYAAAGLSSEVCPAAMYFHENQFAYPVSPKLRVDKQREALDYGFINLKSAMAAKHSYFNSQYNLSSFLHGAENFIKSAPDSQEYFDLEVLEKKCSVLPLGIDFEKIDQVQTDTEIAKIRSEFSNYKFIVWNHRWNYDKNFPSFFNLIRNLKERNLKFKLVMLGQETLDSNDTYRDFQDEFDSDAVCWGYEEDYSRYISWLRVSDILPVTSNQDFFGISIVEAAYCGVRPMLPNRLSYPELFSNLDLFYEDFKQLECKTVAFFKSELRQEFLTDLKRFSWANQLGKYDSSFERLVG